MIPTTWRSWRRKLAGTLAAAALATLAALPAHAEAWRPPIVVWTTRTAPVGFYFGPYFFTDAMGLTTFLSRFGREERTLSDAFGFKHLYFISRGVEVVATAEGQIMSFTFYTQEAPAIQGRAFGVAQVQTDTGLGAGNTWNDVWLVQGRPRRQKVDETGDKLYVLEYQLGSSHDLDFFFRHQRSKEKIVKFGIYPHR